jgi:hypothetical protein
MQRDHAPLRIGRAGLLPLDVAIMLLSSVGRLHGEIQSCFKKLLAINASADQ